MPETSAILTYDVQSFSAKLDGKLFLVDLVTEHGERLQLRMAPMIGLQLAHAEEKAFWDRGPHEASLPAVHFIGGARIGYAACGVFLGHGADFTTNRFHVTCEGCKPHLPGVPA